MARKCPLYNVTTAPPAECHFPSNLNTLKQIIAENCSDGYYTTSYENLLNAIGPCPAAETDSVGYVECMTCRESYGLVKYLDQPCWANGTTWCSADGTTETLFESEKARAINYINYKLYGCMVSIDPKTCVATDRTHIANIDCRQTPKDACTIGDGSPYSSDNADCIAYSFNYINATPIENTSSVPLFQYYLRGAGYIHNTIITGGTCSYDLSGDTTDIASCTDSDVGNFINYTWNWSSMTCSCPSILSGLGGYDKTMCSGNFITTGPPCTNLAFSIVDYDQGSCNCKDGFLSTDCSETGNLICPDNNCSGHGTCGHSTQYKCLCDPGWQGYDCSIPLCGGVTKAGGGTPPQICSGNGQCLNGVCACEDGFTGIWCQYSSSSGNDDIPSGGSTNSNTGTQPTSKKKLSKKVIYAIIGSVVGVCLIGVTIAVVLILRNKAKAGDGAGASSSPPTSVSVVAETNGSSSSANISSAPFVPLQSGSGAGESGQSAETGLGPIPAAI